MGFRFAVEHANWLAHILQPTGATPCLDNEYDQNKTLMKFLDTLSENFYSAKNDKRELEKFLLGFRRSIDTGHRVHIDALDALRRYFLKTPWIALLLPSGLDPETDKIITDSKYLQQLVQIRPEDNGLILQLEDVPQESIALDHIFPAFRIAFSEVTRWPGVLIWTPTGDAAFFELSKNVSRMTERLQWLFSQLSTRYGIPDLQQIKHQFERKLQKDNDIGIQAKIVHISDLHLGSKIARRRLPRVQTIVESVIRELGEEAPIFPVITGDLMHSPNDESIGDLRSFTGFLSSLGIEKPIVVLGNHDVRKNGWLNPQFDQAINISRAPVVWIDEQSIAFACFNSVNGGYGAQGWIGEQELSYVGNALDEEFDKANSYTLIGALHHHPIPVERPSWYKKAWYEKWLGAAFERTEALIDSDRFMEWANLRGLSAVLHGHKHIPRFEKHDDIAIIGCGSTVGMVKTVEKGQTYMSLNIITIDRSRNLLGCRIRAERIPGAGLESMAIHEIVTKSALTTPGRDSPIKGKEEPKTKRERIIRMRSGQEK